MSGSPLSILSLNVRGLRDYKKRRKIYNWLHKHNIQRGISFIQEAHCTLKDERTWTNMWRGKTFFSHGTNQSCGVITLIGCEVEFELFDKVLDDKGRFIILYCKLQGDYLVLINSYAPRKGTSNFYTRNL